MEEPLSRLRYIMADVQELIGAVHFGEAKLRDFEQEIDISNKKMLHIQDYKSYELAQTTYQINIALLNTTLQSLIHWQATALEHHQELHVLSIRKNDTLFFMCQHTQTALQELIVTVSKHIQILGKIEDILKQQKKDLMQQKKRFMVNV